MRVTYDKSVNAAYVYLADHIPSGGVIKTYECDPNEVGGIINLDFNESGQLVGIEILDASQKLPKEVISQAEIIG